MNIKKILTSPLTYIITGYLFTRLVNLLILPIFNDEAIYLDWGFKELNTKGLLFYSLYDGKPPLLMWLFGIARNFTDDPLFSGRLISVLAGIITMVGIYKLTEKYFNKQTSIYSSIFYIVIPIFAFFDRQALMESAISAVGVWSIYLFLDFTDKPIFKNASMLGLVWGVGLFIKQSTLIFIVVETLIYFWLIARAKIIKFNWLFISAFYICLIVTAPLYFQKDFWATFSGNSRYSLTITELLSFPIDIWGNNFLASMGISFWYLSPLVIILLVLGLWKTKTNFQKIILAFFSISILIVIFVSRNLSTRYLVSFLPLAVIFSGHAFYLYSERLKIIKHPALLIALIFPLLITFLLIQNPIKYFSLLKYFTNYSQYKDYVYDWTSGYGVIESVNYLKSISKNTQIMVGVRVDAGNPESAVFAYFDGTKEVKPVYFDAKYTDQRTINYICSRSNMPFYFVSRDGNLAGMNNYLVEDKVFKKPIGESFVAIYKLKSNCGK